MKSVLIRSGFNYNEITSRLTSGEILDKGYLAANSGNMLYLKSIYNLLSKNYDCQSDYYQIERKGLNIPKGFDAFILPLADAFRKDYIEYLDLLTKSIKKTKSKVIVAGVGVRANFDPSPNIGRSFDENVKKFINAVLDKSSIIGVRGYLTADYLTKLGYKEDRDFMVIGCPSMFLNNQDELIIDRNKKSENYAINYSHLTDNRVICKLNSLVPEGNIFCQHTMDYKLMNYGEEFKFPTADDYPSNIEYQYYRMLLMKSKFFSSVNEWLNCLKNYKVSIGSRIHGNIASLLAGVPAIQIMIDSRTRELAEYFDIPRLTIDEFLKIEDLEDYLMQFASKFNVLNIFNQKERYDKFWKLNEIEI